MSRDTANNQTSSEPRVIPHNIDAEQALLGALLVDNRALDHVSDVIDPHHFYEPLHARIYLAIEEVIGQNRVVNSVTIRSFFEAEETLGDQKLTVPQYLGKLVASATSVLNARDYALTIRDLHDLRELVVIGEDIANQAYDSPPDLRPEQQIEIAEARLFKLSRLSVADDHNVPITVAVERTMAIIEKAYRAKSGLVGLSTGFRTLDQDIGGLSPSDLIILAGRPAMGKSALAANIAFRVATNLLSEHRNPPERRFPDEPVPRLGSVLFFSLEMSAEQLIMRQMAADTGVMVPAMREGRTSDPQFEMVNSQSKTYPGLPFHIDTTGAMSIAQMTARARRWKRLHNVQLIVVDYLQLMTTGERGEGRVADVTKITSGLKAMAKEINAPVIALSQLSRAVEQREDKRPQLADLRDSGSIEQDADIVLFVFREEYYLSRAEPPETKVDDHLAWKGQMADASGKCEVIIGKHRHSATKTSLLRFTGPITRFDDLPSDPYEQSDGQKLLDKWGRK